MCKTHKLIKTVELSNWSCYLFGNTPDINTGLCYVPEKTNVPNWFVRYMMKICLGCTWVYTEPKEE